MSDTPENKALRLTPLGDFVNRHTVVADRELWAAIWKRAMKQLDGADTGECAEDGWQILLEEIAHGCQELVRDQKFLQMVNQAEEGSQERDDG